MTHSLRYSADIRDWRGHSPGTVPAAILPATIAPATASRSTAHQAATDMPPADTQIQAIIRRIQAGDIDAFAAIIEHYRPDVFRIIAGHVPADAIEDVAHDTFIHAYQSLDRYTPSHPFAHWLSRITVRRCHDYWRRRYRHKEQAVSQLADDSQQWLDHHTRDQAGHQHDRQSQQREAAEVLALALDKLSPDDRMVVTLVHLEDRSVRETADLLGLSMANVKVRAFRARLKLRTILQGIL